MDSTTRADISVLTTNAEIREDPKQRRELAARIFDTALSVSNFFTADTEAYSPCFEDFLLTVLHDPWSEIRKDSAKLLAKLSKKIPQEFTLRTIESLLNRPNETEQWQVLHGNMLGITALCGHIDSAAHADLRGRVKVYCLRSLAHNTLLVRESARACFSALFLQGNVVRELEDMAHSYVAADREHNSEGHSFSLQSFLDCLGDYLHHHASEYLQGIRNMIVSGDSPEDAAIPSSGGSTALSSRALRLVELCMQHLSSTVRFAAGTLLTSVFFACDKPEDSDIAAYIVRLICTSIEDPNEAEWRCREGFLIAAHDVLQDAATQYLHILCTKDISPPHEQSMEAPCLCVAPAQHDSLKQLAIVVRRILPSVIQDQQSFELRRIAAQLLPPVVRYSLLCSAFDVIDSNRDKEDVSAVSKSLSDELLCRLFGPRRGDTPSPSEQPVVAEDVLEDIFFFSFSAEVAKTIKLIAEAVSSAVKSQSFGSNSPDSSVLNRSHIISYKLKIRNIVHADVSWALNIPRRLGEEDIRTSMWAEITSTAGTAYFGQVCFLGEILLDIFENRLLPKLYQCVRNFNHEMSAGSNIISADMIDGIIACSGVSQCLGDADEQTHPEMSSTFSYAIRALCATQLQLPNLPALRQTSERSISAAVETFVKVMCDSESSDTSATDTPAKDGHAAHICVQSVTDPSGSSTSPALSSSGTGCSARRSSFVAKFSIIDRWLCESASPVLSASVHILSQSDLPVLISVCILWLERIFSDQHWMSIKSTTKKSVIEFIAASILRLEIILEANVRPKLDPQSLHAVLCVALPVLRLSFLKEDNSVSVQLVKLCRITRDVMMTCFNTDIPAISLMTQTFRAIQELVIDHRETRSRVLSNSSESDDDNTATSLEAVKIDMLGEVSGINMAQDNENEINDEDSFSDWDESEGEDTTMFEINKGTTPQKLLRKNSNIYLTEELDIFIAAGSCVS